MVQSQIVESHNREKQHISTAESIESVHVKLEVSLEGVVGVLVSDEEVDEAVDEDVETPEELLVVQIENRCHGESPGCGVDLLELTNITRYNNFSQV